MQFTNPRLKKEKNSVADPGCLSRIQQQQQKRRGRNWLSDLFLVAKNITQFKII